MDNCEITYGKYGQDMICAKTEESFADSFKFYPVEPITIRNLQIHMEDEYNGEIHIDLSNEDTVTYKCVEKRMEQGSTVEIFINDTCYSQNINDHMADYPGEMVKGLMEFYMQNGDK